MSTAPVKQTKLQKLAHDPWRVIVAVARRKLPFLLRSKDPESTRIKLWNYGRLPREHITDVFPGIAPVNVNLNRTFDRRIGLSIDVLELVMLLAIARHINARRIVEIGTSDGNTALNLAENAPDDAAVTTIDLPPDWDGQFQINVPAWHLNVTDRDKVGRQVAFSERAKGKVVQVFGDSAKLDWSQLRHPFDLVFIDGCHFYDYVRVDTDNALRYLAPGGVIVWHDYGAYSDVSRAVDETAQRIEVHALRGTRLAVGLSGRPPRNA